MNDDFHNPVYGLYGGLRFALITRYKCKKTSQFQFVTATRLYTTQLKLQKSQGVITFAANSHNVNVRLSIFIFLPL